MSYRRIFPSFLVSIGLFFSPGSVFAENDLSSKYRVLSTKYSNLNLGSINTFMDQAKVSIKNGNINEAIEELKKAT